MVAPRNVTPLIALIRDFFLQRTYKNALRFEGIISKRTQPPVTLPGGPSHKLHNNYYLSRDGRREVLPPQPVYLSGRKLLSESSAGEMPSSNKPLPKAGPGYDWSTGQIFK
ncbi:NADH dehydrogenase [ubiquinone] 1 alpha subcomplex subunit 7-like [Gigantopelta aegis]|uniref:NADH dehydrogenase [ubiquinone] 1 alpha subcomplex subunit 7-like n=1 Tax=Gigantopelta aegis TaxID=1735272 RepID=UPI001B88D665|nr:NADH dehydrogenase [ubiquinone] 1 alpha subcomplex subunit 7-like [Gigantopelta aegis]